MRRQFTPLEMQSKSNDSLRKRLWRFLSVTGFGFIIFLIIALLGSAPVGAEDRIIAIVNKDTITQSEADAYLNIIILQLRQQYKGEELKEKIEDEKKQLISRMIDDRIILQEARRKNLKARLDKVKYKIEQMGEASGSEADFEAYLRQSGLTLKDLENKLSDQVIMREIIEQEVRAAIVVSPNEVTKFYEAHKDEFLQSEIRSVESLYVEDENTARQLGEDLKGGMDFRAAANQYKAVYARDTVVKAHLLPEIQEALFALKINEISQPLKTADGYYIFKLLEINQPQAQGLSEVNDTIFNYLLEEKLADELLKWLEELRAKAYVVIK